MSIKSKIEAVLFVAAKPVALKQLADLVSATEAEVSAAVVALTEDYLAQERGLNIIVNDQKYQMVTAAAYAEVVAKLVKSETAGELSRPSLETLTIIAYRGPVVKSELDKIRGVNCSMILRNLLLRGLIDAADDKTTGETIYQVSFDFIRFLGINSVEELPDYQRLNADQTIDALLHPAIDTDAASSGEPVPESFSTND